MFYYFQVRPSFKNGNTGVFVSLYTQLAVIKIFVHSNSFIAIICTLYGTH